LTIFLCTLLYLFTLNNLLFFSQKALPFPQLSKNQCAIPLGTHYLHGPE